MLSRAWTFKVFLASGMECLTEILHALFNRRIQREGHMRPTSVTLKMDCKDKRADDMLVGNVSSRPYPNVATLSLKKSSTGF